jgi:hypothetical protein
MKPSTLEWIDKAEGDFSIAQMAWQARKTPNYNAACFHTPFNSFNIWFSSLV